MSSNSSRYPAGPVARGADWLASMEGLPISFRAIVGYYADTGVFDYRSIKVKRHVDRKIDEIITSAFASVENELRDEYQDPGIEFEYETKLTLPAELTLGYLYRRVLEASPKDFNPITKTAKTRSMEHFRLPFVKERERRRTERLVEKHRQLVDNVDMMERVTQLVVEALIDGDMRDALNDEEFEDFEIRPAIDDASKIRQMAETAQRTLQNSIENRLKEFPDAVSEAYHEAVTISERHQEADDRFREMLARSDNREAIRQNYKYDTSNSSPELFDQEIVELPYFKTQYDRVGVIYDGMIDMYRGAGLSINSDFKRSIVLAIIGAQIWLDDVGDYEEDVREGQLTPVTAEYALADSQATAYRNIVAVAETYFDFAKEYATESGTPLTGIAVEYIYRKGDPSQLPR